MTATLQPAKPPPMPHPRFRERRIYVTDQFAVLRPPEAPRTLTG